MHASAFAAPPVIRPVRQGWKGWACGLMALGGMLAVVFLFDPAQHGFYPRCALKAATGYDCPGCGGLRATHQLLHGHVQAAFLLNPLLVASLPFVGWMLIQQILRAANSRRPAVVIPRVVIWLGVAAFVAFGVLRNLPLFALSDLAR